jgi:large subunit ribosomal protein L10
MTSSLTIVVTTSSNNFLSLPLEVSKMALTLAEKQAVVADVEAAAKKAISAVVADYRGLTVTEMTELRANARKAGVYLRVVRNSLSRRALAETEFSCMDEALVGPLCLALSQDAPSDAARLFKDFAKDHGKFEVKALSIGGKLLGVDQLSAVASLPTKDEALAKLLYVMKAPVEKFVRTLAEPHAKLVRTLAAVRDAKQ